MIEAIPIEGRTPRAAGPRPTEPVAPIAEAEAFARHLKRATGDARRMNENPNEGGDAATDPGTAAIVPVEIRSPAPTSVDGMPGRGETQQTAAPASDVPAPPPRGVGLHATMASSDDAEAARWPSSSRVAGEGQTPPPEPGVAQTRKPGGPEPALGQAPARPGPVAPGGTGPAAMAAPAADPSVEAPRPTSGHGAERFPIDAMDQAPVVPAGRTPVDAEMRGGIATAMAPRQAPQKPAGELADVREVQTEPAADAAPRTGTAAAGSEPRAGGSSGALAPSSGIAPAVPQSGTKPDWPHAVASELHPARVDGTAELGAGQAADGPQEGERPTTSRGTELPRELPRQSAAQVIDAVRNAREGSVELRLNPEELGRVRLSLAPGDGAMAVTISAERPETLDLMRRSADQLAADLRALGYTGVDISFGQQGGSGQDRGHGHTGTGESGGAGPGETASPASGRHSHGGALDLRL